MPEDTKIKQFLVTVCEQIRWKKAHSVISQELEDHIIDQKAAFVAEGLDEDTATDKALAEMGDPILIGSELDHTHKPKIEWSIISLTGIILMLGIAVRLLVTSEFNMQGVLINSIISVVLGMACMTIAYFLDFTTIGKYPKSIFLGLIGVSLGVMAVSPVINGRYFYVQFVLLLFPTAFAGIIYDMRTKGYLGIIISGLFFGIVACIAFIIPSFSSVLLYSLTCLILLTFAITKGWFNVNKLMALLLVYIPMIITLFGIVISKPYRIKRLLIAINPFLDPKGAGYIGTIKRDLLAHAKFFGQGDLGINSGLMLPNINTDYILTYLIHRLGWISFIVIMTAILAFIIRAFILCSRQKSVLGKLVSTSVLITFTMQVVLYVVNNLGFQLFPPLTMPLISYGGTATIINMTLIGIMLSVYKSGHLVHDNLRTSIWKRNKLIEIVDGKIIIDLHK